MTKNRNRKLFLFSGERAPAAPVISVAFIAHPPATVGVELTAVVIWSGYPRTGVTYQWSLDGNPIDGATSIHYTPMPGDVGGELTVTITIDNGEGSDTATTAGLIVIGTPPEAYNVVYLIDNVIHNADNVIYTG